MCFFSADKQDSGVTKVAYRIFVRNNRDTSVGINNIVKVFHRGDGIMNSIEARHFYSAVHTIEKEKERMT